MYSDIWQFILLMRQERVLRGGLGTERICHRENYYNTNEHPQRLGRHGEQVVIDLPLLTPTDVPQSHSDLAKRIAIQHQLIRKLRFEKGPKSV
jgi:hypothetical protein